MHPQHSTIARQGAMLLITVLICGTVALGISINVALRGISELDMSFAGSQSRKALAIADSCAEEALLRLQEDATYGGGVLGIGDGSCTIITRSDDAERIIDIAATVDRWTRRARVRVNVTGARLRILSWEQIPA